MDIRGVLFDLDGTLLDTALDLGNAANKALVQYGYPPLSSNDAYQHSSHGSRGLLQAALGELYHRTDALPIKETLLQKYAEAICVNTKVFAGVNSLLASIDSLNLPWGIVTNKPQHLTEPLLAQVNDLARSQINISGDTLPVAKPHPEPLWAAAEAIAIEPKHILYVGDAERDMIAAQKAGMYGCVALWGYLRSEDIPQQWPAHWHCDSAAELQQKLLKTLT